MNIIVTSDIVKSAIASKLSNEYLGTDIYKEQVIQGMTYPSFFINQINVLPIHIYRENYIYEFSMSINYFEDPNSSTLYSDLENKGCELLEVLDSITIDNLLIKAKKGSIETQKIDDVQITTVTYQVPVKKVIQDGIKMETLNITKNIK